MTHVVERLLASSYGPAEKYEKMRATNRVRYACSRASTVRTHAVCGKVMARQTTRRVEVNLQTSAKQVLQPRVIRPPEKICEPTV